MAERTGIEWCHHTMNPVIGCAKVRGHCGCNNCYAENEQANRYKRVRWGKSGSRSYTKTWRNAYKWNRAAEEANERRRVFCASLSDFFEYWPGPFVNQPDHSKDSKPTKYLVYCDECCEGLEVLHEQRIGLLECPKCHSQARLADSDDMRYVFMTEIVDKTPQLDWMLLSKHGYSARYGHENEQEPRQEHAVDLYLKTCPREPSDNWIYRQNVWLGTTVSDQETYDRYLPELLRMRDFAPVLFLSAEPLVGPIDYHFDGPMTWPHSRLVDLVIQGGESEQDGKCRPTMIDWMRSGTQQCAEAGVACFNKQLGTIVYDHLTVSDPQGFWPSGTNVSDRFAVDVGGEPRTFVRQVNLNNSKGSDWNEWPEDLRVREMPTVKTTL